MERIGQNKGFFYGKPNQYLSDLEWQYLFSKMREQVIEQPERQMPGREPHYQYRLCETPADYTSYSIYAELMNQTLETIRSSEHSYCFYLYQIEDLLRFERARLMTEYLPEFECWEVWLKEERE